MRKDALRQARRLLALAFLAPALVALAAGCIGDTDDYCLHHNALVRPPVLSSVPDTLLLDAFRLTAQVRLNRDFMPVSPPDGRPMTARVRLIETDSLPIRETVEPEYIWVVKTRRYWSTCLTITQRPWVPEFIVESSAACGPKWTPGDTVDVAIRVRFRGRTHLLRSTGIRIDMSE